jgi:signal transduction histidine kinase/ligand-binding sensor domain-containing protein
MKSRNRLSLAYFLLIAVMLLVMGFYGNSGNILFKSPVNVTDRSTPSEEKELQTSGAQGSSTVSGEDPSISSRRDLKFEHLSVEHGLSHSSVNCIFQDSQGFMWFGTDDGLNKFDGYTFRVYRHEPGNLGSLSHNQVLSIVEDREGVLWIGTYGGGLNRFDPKTEQITSFRADPEREDSLSNDLIRELYFDHDGTLWIATHGGGLEAFDLETERFTHHQPDPDDPWSLQNWLIDSIYEDREGVLWIGSNNQGLVKYDRSAMRFTHFRFDPENPQSISDNLILAAIEEDSQGVLWVGTINGLNSFDRDSQEFIRYHHNPDDANSLSHDTVNAIYEDRAGNLWIATADGLNQYDRDSGRFIRFQNDPDDPVSLSANFVKTVFEDRAGGLWVGTWGGGLNRLDPSLQRFTHYYTDPKNPNRLNNNIINAIHEDQDGVLWIGTWGGGLNRLDRQSGQWRQFRHDPDDPNSISSDIVTAIEEDQKGSLWVGTAFSGLNHLDRSSAHFTRWQGGPNNPDGLSDSGIRSIYADDEGLLWIGTHGDGINVLDPTTGGVHHFRHTPDDANSLSDNWIYAIHEDRDGVLWFGTRDGGLDRFDRETNHFTHHVYDPADPKSLSSNFVTAIQQDQRGHLWIGTEGGGLNRLNQEENAFTHYGKKEGLPSDSIYGILEDDQGFLWISSGNGLSKFDPKSEIFKNYDVGDGLQSNVFVAGASHASSQGEMFFGGFNGFNAFYPDQIVENPYVPPVVLTSLTQSGEAVALDIAVEHVSEVTFQRPNNYFEFEFAALNYTQPEKNQYAYMLEGYDEEWNLVGTKRLGQYDNLPLGNYTLRVIGSNNDGVWNEEGVSMNVKIVPPIWETWWFRGGIALALLCAALGSYRLRVRNLEAHSRELEQKVEERTAYLEALYRAEEQMHRHLNLDQVLKALVDVAIDTLHADKSAVLLWEEGQKRWVIKVARGFSHPVIEQLSFAQGEGTVGQVAANGEPIFVMDAASDPLRARERPETVQTALLEGIRSFMQLPIRVNGETFGVFNVSFIAPQAFGLEEQRLFLALVQRASKAIENARLYEQSQELAALEERQRLARDLHDAVTQTLFSTSLIAEVLPRIWERNPEDGRRRLEQVRQATRSALAEMRSLLLELRPSGLAEADLGDLLQQLADAVKGRTRLSINVDVEDEVTKLSLPEDVHIALYRIAQEALNNVAKHAKASQVNIILHRGADRVSLSIHDNGRGFEPQDIPPAHFGIGIMRERAETAGARLEIKSHIGLGTQVTITWPENR